MNIPSLPINALVETDGPRKGYLTDTWFQFFNQLITILQTNAGNLGIVMPSVSSDPDSVTPSAPDGQLGQLQATFNPTTASDKFHVVPGTVVFDPFETNGGSPDPNGQLKVLLNDGTFHNLTNS